MTSIAEQLDGVSLAEWEYAWRFADHLAVGDPRPDATGFDADRVALIERALRDKWYARRERLRKRRP